MKSACTRVMKYQEEVNRNIYEPEDKENKKTEIIKERLKS